MGFFMDGLDAEAYDRTYSDRQLVSRIIAQFKPQSVLMGFVSVTILMQSLMDTALPLLTARGVDAMVGEANLQLGLVLMVMILIAGAMGWVYNYVRQRQTSRVVANVVFRMRQQAFAAIMQRDMSFYDEFPSGSIVSRVTSDTQEFSNTVTLTLNLASQLLLVVILLGVMFFIHVQLALISVALLPLVTVAALSFRHIARNVTTQVRRILAQVNTTVQETVTGIAVAKNFRQEQAIFDTFTDVNEHSYDLNLRQGFVFAAIFPILFLLTGMATAMLLYFGGHLAFAGELTTGEWFLFITTVERLMFPMTSIASFWSQFQLGMAAAERVFALIDTEPLVVQHDNRPVPLLEGHIQFRDVHFRYSEQEQVLEDFNLDIAPGETVALVGHTGAGKSSLGKLVARFYEFQKGLLLVDGIDIRSFDLDAYHRQLGMVAQSPFLFSGTVRDNIRYGREDATDDVAEKAAHAVGGGFWLRSLPQGLDTETGEMGSSLSLGQRQLVALARLLVQDPRMIILDEATASVDPLTEAQIQEGLDLVLRDRTAIVIAHRLSTIQAADRIIVMRHGRIIEEGSHDSLMLQGGHYAELYATYFRHHAMDYELA